jgi:trimethylamine--corrinoid protein Co-methyltransferase
VSGVVSQFAGADLMCGAGLLNGARIFSFEQLLLDCETYDLLRAVSQGFEINEETLAVDVIHSVGPRNHFLKTKHTKAHMRAVWQPTLLDRTSWTEWIGKGRPSANDHAREKARSILATHQPEPLPNADRIQRILADYERSTH